MFVYQIHNFLVATYDELPTNSERKLSFCIGWIKSIKSDFIRSDVSEAIFLLVIIWILKPPKTIWTCMLNYPLLTLHFSILYISSFSFHLYLLWYLFSIYHVYFHHFCCFLFCFCRLFVVFILVLASFYPKFVCFFVFLLFLISCCYEKIAKNVGEQK